MPSEESDAESGQADGGIERYADLESFQRDVLWAIIAAGGDRPRYVAGVDQPAIMKELRHLGHAEPDGGDVIEAIDALREVGWVNPSDEHGYVVTHHGWTEVQDWLSRLDRAIGGLNPDDDGEKFVLRYMKVAEGVEEVSADV